MNRKTIVSSLALLLLVVSAIGAPAASKRVYSHTTHTYTGKTSAGTAVKLRIEFDFNDPGRYNNSTWVTSMTFYYPSCGGGSNLVVNGAIRVNKTSRSFSSRYAPAYANKDGYVEITDIRGKVANWDARTRSWRKAAGTVRVAYAEPAYTDDAGVDHPAYHCDHTYTWTAIRRG